MGTGTWVAIATPLSGFVLGIIGFLFARRQDRAAANKTDADALKVVQDATLALLDPLQKQIDRQAIRLDQLRAENTYLQSDVKELRARVDIVEDDRDVLADAVRVQVQWEDSGRLDPPGVPSIPAKVRSILNRLHAA